MPMKLSELQQRVAATSPAPDADLLTRLRAATRVVDDLQPFFTWLRSSIWFAIGMIQDPDATEAEQTEALERLALWL